MVWCHLAPSHYLSQCWPRSILIYGVTRPQWANCLHTELLWGNKKKNLTSYIFSTQMAQIGRILMGDKDRSVVINTVGLRLLLICRSEKPGHQQLLLYPTKLVGGVLESPCIEPVLQNIPAPANTRRKGLLLNCLEIAHNFSCIENISWSSKIYVWYDRPAGCFVAVPLWIICVIYSHILQYQWLYGNLIDELVQERCNCIAYALELHLSCTNPSILGQSKDYPSDSEVILKEIDKTW